MTLDREELLELLENEFSNSVSEEGILDLLEEGGEFSLEDLRAVIETDDEEVLEAVLEFLETEDLIENIDDYNYLVKVEVI